MTTWGLHPSPLFPQLLVEILLKLMIMSEESWNPVIDLCPLMGSLVDIIIGHFGQKGSVRDRDTVRDWNN